jgi:hypothetical protein
LGKTDIINSASNVNIVGDSRTTINLGALSSNAASQVNGVVNIFGCNTAGTKIYQYVGGASQAVDRHRKTLSVVVVGIMPQLFPLL